MKYTKSFWTYYAKKYWIFKNDSFLKISYFVQIVSLIEKFVLDILIITIINFKFWSIKMEIYKITKKWFFFYKILTKKYNLLH